MTNPRGLRTRAQDAQANTALEKAWATRRARGQLRREFKAWSRDFDRALRGNDPDVEPIIRRMKLTDVLTFMPGIGPATAHDVAERCELPPSVQLIALTFERRAQIADMVKAALALDPVQAPPPQIRPPAVE